MEEYLLSGKVFCGDCGKPMVGESGTSSTGETYHYYKCSARKKRLAPCSKKTERKDELEDLVVAYICHEVLTDEMIEKIAAKQFELLEAESADKSLLKSMESEYKDVSQKVNNLLEAIEDGLYTRTTKSRLTELEDRQAELEDKIIREKLKKPEFTKEHIIFWLNKFRAGDINDFEYKRAVINSLVNSVYVYDESDDDDDGGDGKKVVVALTLKNVPVRTLTRSDVQKMGHHFKQHPNEFLCLKYLVVFCFSA